ncbi:YpdA family putative bacillithiol disulfide reductase [Spongiivirga citrea]|uniref:YpdA family putative bacillithiol disulfide reductase n=1 Tax=Spongiivirga citrea TaxID=1481457 RepID=A0A6M0CQJ3_9FLAO|nr:YpdA family putative bacillithiol disulfide reductase [Spongiivirga citrea]NER18304.1 YpdA family putative bacillithiol disulfide reductase [Spongiivirga citrea]
MSYDLIIVGGGPIGIACGLEAQKQGLNYLIIEKGCIVNSLYNYPEGMTFFSTSDKLEIDDIPFISKNAKPYKDEALEYYRRIVTNKSLNINLFEKVLLLKKENELFEVTTEKDSYSANNLVLSTGFYDIPNLLKVPGEDLPKVKHYYDNAHYYAQQKVIVVGANNSAVDAALEIYRKGGDVTMIIRGEGVGKRVKYWAKPDIENRIKEGSIKAFYNSTIKEIREKDLVITTDKGEVVLENDYVLALTGYQPNFSFLESIGVSLSEDGKRIPQYNPDTMETNISGLFLAGVVCGGMETHKWFIENSRIHPGMIMNTILKSDHK